MGRTKLSFIQTKIKKTSVFVALIFLLTSNIFSQNKYSYEAEQGFEAFRKNDWTNAMFFLRKACSTQNGFNAESLYMLVMSEMNAGEYDSALKDSNLFLQKFQDSFYTPYMIFQNGKALHFLDKNEEAIIVLSDFCHQNPESELYSTALYWIAECFYAEFNFDSALSLYERIVSDFPGDQKFTDSKYRIEMIEQRQREEKLIYLLKVTGEENLSAREDYERQLKLYQTEDKMGLRKSLIDSQSKIDSLESQLSSQKKLNEELSEQNSTLLQKIENLELNVNSSEIPNSNEEPDNYDTTVLVNPVPQQTVEKKSEIEQAPVNISTASSVDEEVESLKRKARQLQYILDQQNKGE